MQKILVVSGMALLAASAGAQTSHNRTAAKSSQAAKKAVAKPSVFVKGHVALPDGKAGAGARVYVAWLTENGEAKFQRLATNGKGDFQGTFPNIGTERSLVLTAFVPGQGLCKRMIPFAPKTPLISLEMKLQPLVSLSGRLVRSDGHPAANITLCMQTLAEFLRAATPVPIEPNDTSMLHNGSSTPNFLLPTEDLKAYFTAKTDAQGRFTFSGLPGSTLAGIALSEGLTLAPGSATPILLLPGEKNDAGVLVATRLGRARIRVVDREGKPVGNASVSVMSTDATLQILQSSRRMQQVAGTGHAATNAQLNTNAQGEAETPELYPGDYRLLVQGRSSVFHVEEGQTGKPITLALRQGPLKGRIVDAGGKPVAHVRVRLHAGMNSIELVGGVPLRGVMGGDVAVDTIPDTRGQAQNGPDERSAISTDAEGRFALPNFAWGLESVTVSAQKGDSYAEYTGSPTKIGVELSLHLKAAALIPVTGRLLDAHRQPITNAAFKTLHWQNTPRIVWLMNARTGKADAEGRFQLAGLERGASFSLVTASLDGRAEGKQAFESPRFVAQGVGSVQDLGDIIVHPSHDGEDDIATLYGLEGTPEILPGLAGAIPNPSPTDVEEAKQALMRYRAALKTQDWETARRGASRASLGWSENKSAFLRNTALGAYAGDSSSSALLPLRFVPRFALAQLLPGILEQNSATGDGSGSAMRNAAHEFGQNQNVVFLAEKHSDVLTLAGVLRKEGNTWRVLNAPAGLAPEDLFLMDDAQSALPAAADLTRVAPFIDAAGLEAARLIGEQYLRVWAQGRHAPMLTLTSPLSAFFTEDLGAFAKAFPKRADGGLCPLAPETPIHLQSMEGLTLWEQEWLAHLSQILAAHAVAGLPERRGEQFAHDGFAKRGDMTVLRYTDGERAFAMLLARYDGKWQVVEPALPL